MRGERGRGKEGGYQDLECDGPWNCVFHTTRGKSVASNATCVRRMTMWRPVCLFQ